jgi:hypothetical protein
MILSKEIISIYKYDLIMADIRTGRNMKDALHPDSMSNDPDAEVLMQVSSYPLTHLPFAAECYIEGDLAGAMQALALLFNITWCSEECSCAAPFGN